MFLITVSYKKPIEIVDKYLTEHRSFLDEGYAKDYLVVSGPKNPRDGGVIISCLKDRKILEDYLKRDPFYIHEIADYQITEFMPIKYHQKFECFLNL